MRTWRSVLGRASTRGKNSTDGRAEGPAPKGPRRRGHRVSRKLTSRRYEEVKALGADLIEDYELVYPLEPFEIADVLGVIEAPVRFRGQFDLRHHGAHRRARVGSKASDVSRLTIRSGETGSGARAAQLVCTTRSPDAPSPSAETCG